MNPFNPAIGVPLAVALRIAIIAIALLATRRIVVARYVAFVGSAMASLVTGMMAVSQLQTGTPLHGVLAVHRASQLFFTYSVDGLTAGFLLVLAVLAIPIAIYNIGYLAHETYRRRSVFIGVTFNVLVGAVELVFAAGDAIAFLFAWELMTLAAAALIATEHEKPASRGAAYLYLVMSHVATGCLIAGFLTLAAGSGSLAFTALLSGDVARGTMRDGLFVLFFLGFGVKAGVIPLHVWRPEAHPAAPTSISAMMSAVLLKAGVYGIVRVCAFGLGVPRLSWGVAVVGLGGVSAVLGVLYALMQHDLKRLLAHHSIENIGIILLGLGAGMMALTYGRSDVASIGTAAALYHVLNHAVFWRFDSWEAPQMTTSDNVVILCAAGMLVSAYLIVGQKALFTAIRSYGVQSLLLGIVAATIAVSAGRYGLLVTAALTVTLKGMLIPWFLMRVIDRIGIHREVEPFLSVPASLLVCLGLTVAGYLVSTGFPEGSRGLSHHVIGVALSMLLIGLFLMVTRKKAISQILALLTVENAVFLVAVGVTSGMPLIVELGIAFDVILAVLVLGVLAPRIVERFESMDVSRLSKLKG